MNIPGNPTETTNDPTSEMVASIKANIESLQARIKANKDKMWLIKAEVAGLEKSVKLAQAMIETITKGPEA
jgi:archaellum component FlaC